MYCSQCATKLEPNAVFCPACSKPVASFIFDESKVAQVEPLDEDATRVRPQHRIVVPPPNRGSMVGPVIVGVIIGTLITAAAVAGTLLYLRNSAETRRAAANTAPIAAATPEPTSTPLPTPTPNPKILIVNEQFPVPAGDVHALEFTVVARSRVSGGFVAYGGSNDIDAVLTDEAGRIFYRSGYTTKGKINVVIPPGTYSLVFDNRRAWITDKSVAAEVYFQEL